jgi:hypothetical protein
MKTTNTFRAFICSLMILSVVFIQRSLGQGCVAVRPMSCSAAGHADNLSLLKKGQWQQGVSFRYFESYKHFRGDSEEHERVEDGTEVINISRSLDLSLLYAATDRLNFSVNVPFISYDRSSLYEHYGNSTSSNPEQKRFNTYARGIGDIRATVYYWLFNPDRDSLNGNISLGFGVKAPTGDENVQDVFHRRTSSGKDSLILRPVDQSIQLGDGGWGFNLEAQVLWRLSHRSMFFFNGFYLFNPKNVNSTLTSGTYATTATSKLTEYHSVADQYAARMGISWNALPKQGFSASIGVRAEGIPSKDLIGDNQGFRRPGYIISAEPGLSFMKDNLNFSLLVPYALYRNRIKSYSDIERDKMDPSVDHHGDAAFADYLINFSVSYRLGCN